MDAPAQANYRTLWLEGFSDIAPERLRAAFIACLRSLTYKTMPGIGDVRQHLSKAEDGATNLEAERKWQQVLAYAQSLSPDIPAPRNAPRIKEQTMAAIHAAGGLSWIRECPLADLQWAKKRFIESYVAWQQLDKGQYLLPDGEIKKLIANVAQEKALPGVTR